MAERDYWNHPGGNLNVWNTSLGTGAIWSLTNDPDTLHIWPGKAIINPVENYGCMVWVSHSASDPSATFIPYASADFERGPGGRGIMADTRTVLRAPVGAYTPGAAQGGTPPDGQFVVFDRTGHPGKVYHFAPLTITPGRISGTYTYNLNQQPMDMYFGGVEDALSNSFATDYETGNANFTQCAGAIRGYDIDPNQNPARLPPPNQHLPKIQHVLRYAMGNNYLKHNMASGDQNVNTHLKPSSWPQYYHDWQGAIQYNRYYGNIVYGSLLGIPMNVAMPAGLSDPGKQLWYAYQHFGAITRDQAGGGIHASADQEVDRIRPTWRGQAAADLDRVIKHHLRVLRNQRLGGTTMPINGPGTRLDPTVPYLRGTSPTPPTPVTPSPSGTVVLSGSSGVIVDNAGNLWTLPASHVVRNGIADTGTGGVTRLAYVGGYIYHENDQGLWWRKTTPDAAWVSVANPLVTTPPVFTESANNSIVVAGTTGVIVDSTGGKWTVPGNQVVFNDVVDSTTSGVARIAYVNKVVWRQNTAGLWWGRSAPYVGVPWTPTAGTIVSPLPPPPEPESANNTVVLSGSGSKIIDASGNTWTLPGTQVVINGNTDTVTSSVARLAYVNKIVWHENTSGLWWGKTSPTADWLPGGGTATSPLPGTPPTSSGALLLPAGYLSTQGNQTIDQNGNRVRIAAIGWNGGDGTGNAPQGLMSATLSGMMTKMVSLGFNCIRLPYNDRGFFSTGTTNITTNSFNPSLVGQTPLQVMDAIVAAAKVVGLKVIINHHTNEGGRNGWGGQQPNGLWFSSGPGTDNTDGAGNTGTVTKAMFQANWVALANRYKNNDTVIGFDLHNEPLAYGGMSTWGDNGINDIRVMSQTVGNAILAVNPGVLIICEGPQHYTSNFAGTGIAPGGDLSRAASHPVVLTDPSKVLYSVHNYPRAIAGADDSGPDFIANLNASWGFLVKQNLAAVWIGEMGGSFNSTGGDTRGGGSTGQTSAQLIAEEQAWAADFTAYLNGTAETGPTFTASQQGIGTCWWVWGYLPGQPPEGVLQGSWNGTARPEQLAVYSQYRYTKTIAGTVLPRAPVLTTGTPSTVSVPLSWTSAAPVPAGTESADHTVIPDGSSEEITTARGDRWGVSGGRVVVNGTIDNGTGGVARVAYVNGQVWQNNTAGMWWFKTVPGDVWGPGSGTSTSPLTLSYQPQFKLTSASTWEDFGTPIFTRSVTVVGVTQGVAYNFRIVATNPSGSVASNIATATVAVPSGEPAVAPSAPVGLTTTNVTGTSLTFGWQASTGTLPINYQPQYQKHPTTTTPPVDPQPPTNAPNLTPSGLISYFNSIAGSGVISGEFIERGPLTPLTNIQASTGHWLGMAGGDYWWFNSTQLTADTRVNADLISYWNNKGLVTLSFHASNPETGAGVQAGTGHTFNATQAMTAGHATNTKFLQQLTSIGNGLKELQDAGVVCIVRPYHEHNGGWFWWGRDTVSDAQFVQLWRYTHNHWVNTMGLNKLVFWWSVNQGFGTYAIAGRYPGDAYVDIVGADMYTTSPANNAGEYNTLLGYGKPVSISEFGAGSPGNPNFNQQTLINAIKTNMPKTVIYQQWWDRNGSSPGWGHASVTNAAGALSDPYVLNRGELSFFTTSAPPTNPPTYTPSPDKTVVNAGSGGSITDSAGRVWTITAGGLVAVNNVADTTTSGVIQIAYVNNQIWQGNSSGLWWFKNTPADLWLPGGGTNVNPVTGVAPSQASPDKTVVASGTAGVITDSVGRKWTLPGTQVVVDGSVDTSTSSVVQIAYVGGQVWQNNTAGYWWWKVAPTDPWQPAGGTLTNPLTGVTPNPSSLIVAPLVGTVTTGTWQEATYQGRTGYGVLPPANYDTTKTYPLVLFMHQFGWGNSFSFLRTELDPWFNTVTWRRNYPCFVLAPLCNQGSPASSAINWGGVEGANQTAQNDAIALVRQLKIQYPIAANKVYVTGCSMGGIGSWDDIIKFNRLTGTLDKLFSAALILAGATYSNGAAGSSGGVPPSPTVTANLRNVPIWAIHGQNDTTVPLAWDRAMNSAIGTANGGQMVYTELAGIGHNVWDDYYLRATTWNWLFSKTV